MERSGATTKARTHEASATHHAGNSEPFHLARALPLTHSLDAGGPAGWGERIVLRGGGGGTVQVCL